MRAALGIALILGWVFSRAFRGAVAHAAGGLVGRLALELLAWRGGRASTWM